MVQDEVGGASCCRFRIPTIPTRWLLFIDFAFTFGTTIVYFADIVTDIITLKMYWDREWYHAFGFSIGFIIAPSILLAILECQFLIKTYGKDIKWGSVILRTLLNIPFQLTVIWYHFKLSYTYLKVWLDNLRKRDKQPIEGEDRRMSMSNLADIDDRTNTIERRAISSVEVPASAEVPAPSTAYLGHTDHTWWKQLTREEWLSHLNKMKLTESMLESLPQLLINLYLIVRYANTPVIQYISATLSYLSLCGGIVRYDKTRKDNEAERLMVDRTLLHSRAFATRLEWPQILLLSLYKSSFLAARILVFVYFTVYFQVYFLIFVFIHWAVLMGYLVYLWYPTDLHKKTRQLVQADYKFRAYMFLSQDFLSVFHNSLVGIFISVRPRSYAFLGQPYCYMFWYYFCYVIENIILFLIPGIYFSVRNEEVKLHEYEYYIVLVFELVLNVVGAILCATYYFSVHKMSTYTRNAYPQITKLQNVCCCSALGTPVPKEWTVCKQAETSEIFYLRREKLREYKSGYTTVVRANRKRGRNLECFIDERGKIFYAPRSKLFKKLPTTEEEEVVNMRSAISREGLDDLDGSTPTSRPLRRQDSQSTVRNERLVGEEPSIVEHLESKPLLSTEAPPLPSLNPQSSTPIEKDRMSYQSSRVGKDGVDAVLPSGSERQSTRSHGSRPLEVSPIGKDLHETPENLTKENRESARSQSSKRATPPNPSSVRSLARSGKGNLKLPSSNASQRSTSSHRRGGKIDGVQPASEKVQTTSSPQDNSANAPKGNASSTSPESKRSSRNSSQSTKGNDRIGGEKSPHLAYRRFSPENMWKPRKETQHHTSESSGQPRPQGSKQSPNKDNVSPITPKKDDHESHPFIEKSSHKSEKSKRSSSHSSHERSHKRSPHRRRKNDSARDSSSRGSPVGQTWI